MRGPPRRSIIVWFTLAFFLLFVCRLLLDRGYRLHLLSIENSKERSYAIKKSRVQSLSYRGEDVLPGGTSAYIAGAYMAGRRSSGNESSCIWYYGLPRSLSYPSSQINWTPEIGEKSPYRVLPFAIRGRDRGDREDAPPITLCTHATADQVYGIVELARRWEGPLSLAVFAPGLDAGLAVALLDRACRCETAMSKVSVHLVFPAGRVPALGRAYKEKDDCTASDLQWRGTETERWKSGMTYPINVARNVARTSASTVRVLVSDIELLPSERLASGFVAMVHGRPPKLGVVFVLPVFEIDKNEQPPSNKRELLSAAKAGLAVYFHRFLCPHCQRFPGLTRWMIRTDPGKVKPLIITRREYPHHRWEPVFIGMREDPLYTENMSWEGKQDKMAQMFEMCLLNYRLVVLDGAFLVHTPGIKRKPKSVSVARQEFLRLHEKRNAKLYQRVVKRLLAQYPNNRKCTQ
ncbi:PREDICTED: beta-1,4-glucuronyltransferase 1-like isoform X2 [Polistes canadensis]|uniref:beta-1,4-glucuronyltransferase 1-like isoform X2 n=1 Tax=Polistes canadensis TaxID=91411 RepID=UPI000718B8BA|nr:PREDICTED: beta-1,4-glucuronyltransferase 1-like isoform X2 [Polistes canadensis]